MWPRATTRTTGSRRDAFARALGVLIGGATVLAGVALLLLERFDPERGAALRGVTVDAVAPVWQAASTPLAAATDVLARIGDYVDAGAQNRDLRAELEAARLRATQAELLAAENLRLRRLVRLVEPPRRRVATARIAGASGASLVETAIVSAGTADGVRIGQPVTTDRGLIGRVTEVGGRAARVLLVSDGGSRVPVRIVRTGAPGLLAGVGGGMTELRFVETGTEPAVRIGDRLVTSGDGGLFAPDIPVAVVVAFAREGARARLLARPDLIGFAVIEAAYLPAPPPLPTAVAQR